jgi:transglutaminase-like putative cysteine protease
MRFKIRHETIYDYAQPARFALQVLRVTPRPFEAQSVRRWRVEVDADARLDRGEDAYGNITHTVFVDGPLRRVRILIDGEVDRMDTAGVMAGTFERLPLPIYLRETRLTRATPALRRLGRSALTAEGGDRLATLHRIMRQIHSGMGFEIGATHAATTADEAFTAGHGVCQDFAHILIAAARTVGIPARYVGGYYLRTDTIEQDAGHAWAEAYVDGIGWVGFDPAHGVCVTDRYVRVAIGLDYLDAAPVRGCQVGGADESLAVSIRVAEGQRIVEG